MKFLFVAGRDISEAVNFGFCSCEDLLSRFEGDQTNEDWINDRLDMAAFIIAAPNKKIAMILGKSQLFDLRYVRGVFVVCKEVDDKYISQLDQMVIPITFDDLMTDGKTLAF
jgi:hypothetical protein